jgi:D-glycero-alpha-D-manno-heptose 1-phosphate guanylyltransferase
MEAIILAGGFGTRLKHVIPNLPKPMAPIAGQPFLEILLSMLSRKGFKRVILSLGFMAEKIIGHFGNEYQGMELVYEVESLPLGTGGAVRAALTRCLTDHVFIFNGDTYLDLEIKILENIWQKNHHPLIVVREVPDSSRFGTVDINSDGRVIAFLEKGKSGPGIINAGCYVFPTSSLNDFVLGKKFSLENDYFVKNLHHIRFDSFVTQGQFIDIGIPEEYVAAQIILAGL